MTGSLITWQILAIAFPALALACIQIADRISLRRYYRATDDFWSERAQPSKAGQNTQALDPFDIDRIADAVSKKIAAANTTKKRA
jgi:hypothetical protein